MYGLNINSLKKIDRKKYNQWKIDIMLVIMLHKHIIILKIIKVIQLANIKIRITIALILLKYMKLKKNLKQLILLKPELLPPLLTTILALRN